jgi:hypothetical protein
MAFRGFGIHSLSSALFAEDTVTGQALEHVTDPAQRHEIIQQSGN